jgi:hypothetical protein
MTFNFQDAESGMKIAAVAFNEHIKTLDHAVQKAYGKQSAGYHACQLVLYKHSKVLVTPCYCVSDPNTLFAIAFSYR